MRILFFTENLGAGGKQRRLVELIKGLSKKPNYEMELVLTDENIHYQDIFSTRVKIHFAVRKFIKKDPRIFFKFYKISKEFKPDVINVWGTMSAIYSLPTKIFLRIPLVNNQITDANNYVPNSILSYKTTFPFSDMILANSEAGLKSYSAPKERSSVIYNGFDFERLINLDDTIQVREKFNIKTDYVVGMAASFMDRKDYATYIKAAQTVLRHMDNVTFICVGDGDDSKFKDMLNPSEVEKILFLGHRKNVENIMNICHIGVLTSNCDVHAEGISNSLLEFMALGKPVIANDNGGNPELIVEGKNGFLIDSKDYKTLSSKLLLLLNDDGLRKRFGLKSYEIVRDKFSIQKMINSFCEKFEVYKK